jgi:putative transcriptional regulator
LRRRREIADPAAHLVAVRTRHRLSQRQFADRLGFDVRTLQNWEQGRNRPDSAVLALVTLFDRDPAAVEFPLFAPVP